MTYADRIKEIEVRVSDDNGWAFIANARADVTYLLSRVKELESALGEGMRTMRDDADVFNRLTAIKEGRNE